jgi:hypothetical protein
VNFEKKSGKSLSFIALFESSQGLSARPSHMSSMKVTMSEEEDAVMVTIVA